MKVLVTGGGGFIGSHTVDRLLSEGHEVIVIDALRPPVHQNGKPGYLSDDVEFHHGDVRDRELMTSLLRRVDAVYHLAAYQDYLPDFSTFFDINVTGTALLYEIAAEHQLDLNRVVVASSQAVLGEGLYRCEEHGEFCPDIRSTVQLEAAQWDIPVRHVAGRRRVVTQMKGFIIPRILTECRNMLKKWLRSIWASDTALIPWLCAIQLCKGRDSRFETHIQGHVGFSAFPTKLINCHQYTKMGWRVGISSIYKTLLMRICWC